MMRLAKYLAIFGSVLVGLALLTGLGALFFKLGWIPAVAGLLVLGLIYCWVFQAFFHYRYGRQDELVHVMVTALEAKMPLVPALRAYSQDRPQGLWRDAWVATMMFLLLPGYYWLWHKKHNFDQKVSNLTDLLEDGVPLDRAMLRCPGVASRETILAAGIGQVTGNMALCLRTASRRSLTNAWLEMVPRFTYPLTILLVLLGISGFWMIYIGPKMQKIFKEFKQEIPEATARVFQAWDVLLTHGIILGIAFVAVVSLAISFLIQPSIRWYFPGLARLYRTEVQSRIMKMLSVLLGAGKPVPEALGLLASSGYFAPVAAHRLNAARSMVQQGEPLAQSLCHCDLLPKTMVPLIQAAERMRNLPWALSELGENQGNRVVRMLQRFSQLTAPILLLGVGLLVGTVVVGMFMPIVDLITRTSE
jgi:type IV pilus assembly protein PilC